jgi:hypothetical protein
MLLLLQLHRFPLFPSYSLCLFIFIHIPRISGTNGRNKELPILVVNGVLPACLQQAFSLLT